VRYVAANSDGQFVGQSLGRLPEHSFLPGHPATSFHNSVLATCRGHSNQKPARQATTSPCRAGSRSLFVGFFLGRPIDPQLVIVIPLRLKDVAGDDLLGPSRDDSLRD
jgi:hypothetical protein